MTSARVLIIGGAIMGSLIAWSLRREGFRGPISVIEKDKSFEFASTARSAACIRLQFATPLNIKMSLHGVEFLRQVKTHLGPDTEIGYIENGYLILGGEDQVEARRALIKMQRAEGADIVAFTPNDIAERFPYLDLSQIGIAGFGASGEGWFDAYTLMQASRKAARAQEVTFVDGEVTGCTTKDDALTGVVLADGEELGCDICVLAAGAWSGGLAKEIGIDLPVVPRKRTVFNFKAPLDGKGMPMLFDTSGFWLRPEGEDFIGGIYPSADQDRDATGDFEPHHDLMLESFWPALAARIPAMEELRLTNSWAGHYEMNTLDQNGVVGPHNRIANLIFATGFSGHGVMHAPAVGRGVAEWIVHGEYRSLDLSPLGWARIAENRPFAETVVI